VFIRRRASDLGSLGWFVLPCAVALFSGCRAQIQAPAIGDASTLALHGPQGILCAAVAIAPNLAVTADHCVPSRIVRYTTAELSGRPARSGVGFVVRRDAASDLAAFTATGLVPAEMSRVAPDLSRSTRLVAHVPAPWSATTIRPISFDESFVHTERIDVGASGSGLWNDAGELVGVAIGNDRSSGYFATIPRISRMLRGTIEVSLAPPVTPERTDAAPAVWHDPHLALDGLFTIAKTHRQRLDAEMQNYGSTHGK
jgi:hypothetical protein